MGSSREIVAFFWRKNPGEFMHCAQNCFWLENRGEWRLFRGLGGGTEGESCANCTRWFPQRKRGILGKKPLPLYQKGQEPVFLLRYHPVCGKAATCSAHNHAHSPGNGRSTRCKLLGARPFAAPSQGHSLGNPPLQFHRLQLSLGLLAPATLLVHRFFNIF